MAIKTKSSSQKKELTPTQQKVRTVLNWIVNVICIVLIIFALVVAIFTIIRSTNPDKITRIGDTCYFTVMSDSMEPTFKEHDVIVAKAYDGDGSDLKVGQVITFKFTRYYDNDGYDEFNTHRIIHIDYDETTGEVKSFRTRGDKKGGDWHDALEDSTTWDGGKVFPDKIVATWGDMTETADGGEVFTTGKVLKGAGALAGFMQHPVHGRTRFFCIVVLPLILLFAIYAFILVRTLVIAKLEKDKKVAGETAISVESMTEEEKQLLMQQLLASQNASSAQGSADTDAADQASDEADSVGGDEEAAQTDAQSEAQTESDAETDGE